MTVKKSIHWFRQDLRINDNPSQLSSQFDTFLPIYILDDVNSGEFSMGAASRWWLHHSLKNLMKFKWKLLIYKGNPSEILKKLIEENEITHISWNRCYEPWRIERDKDIKRNWRIKI